MASYSTGGVIVNFTSENLEFDKSGAQIPHGEWIEPQSFLNPPVPPLQPMNIEFYRSESAGIGTGTEAYVSYIPQSGGLLTVGWDDPGALRAGHMRYRAVSTSSVLDLTHTTSTSDGYNSVVAFIVFPKDNVAQRPWVSNVNPKTDSLGGCDMVLSISTDVINQEFLSLWLLGIIKTEWNMQDATSGVGFSTSIDAPSITITENSANNAQVILKIKFTSGTFTYWEGHGPQSKEVKADMTGWTYAFTIGFGNITFKQQDIDKHIPQTLSVTRDRILNLIGASEIPEEEFSIQQLFLDLENANVAAFDPEYTTMPGLSAEGLIQLQITLTNYFKQLAASGNPYILGYPLIVPHFPTTQSMIYPSDCKLVATYTPNQQTLNYLMMANGNKFDPNKRYNISSPLLFNDQMMCLSINYDLFNKQFISKLVNNISDQLVTKYGDNAKLKAITTTEGGKYSWFSYVQESGKAGDIDPIWTGGNENDGAQAAYAQGYLLSLMQVNDNNQLSLLANLQVASTIAVVEYSNNPRDNTSDGSDKVWSCCDSPLTTALLLAPGADGTVTSTTINPEAAVTKVIYDGGLESEAKAQEWVADINEHFEAQIDQLSKPDTFKITINSALQNCMVLPCADFFIYTGIDILNKAPTPSAIKYPAKSVTGTTYLPAGDASNNLVIFGASYKENPELTALKREKAKK